MPKRRFIDGPDAIKELKKEKRAHYNPKYDKLKEDIDPEDPDPPKHSKTFKDPKDVPLDQCVQFISKGPGSSIEIVFEDDASEEEINAVLSKIKQVYKL